MEHKEYKLLKDREQFFWWNVGRRRILKDALRRHMHSNTANILDVGCGPGGNILFLADFGKVTGLDSSEEALSFAQKRGFYATARGDGEHLPFGDESFDVVSILDVLEHIDDDTKALHEIFRTLKPGGFLLLTVPAYTWMWSEHDLALHHKRRYAKKELLVKIRTAGFSVKESSHFVFPSIPFRALKIFIGNIRSALQSQENKILKTDDIILPPFLNAALIVWLGIERHAMKFFPLPCGSSIFVVAKKPL